MDTEKGPENEILNQMKSNTSSSGSFSTSGLAPIPIAFDLATHSEEIVTVPGYTLVLQQHCDHLLHSFYNHFNTLHVVIFLHSRAARMQKNDKM